MSNPAGRADPRTIVTPDAFSIAPELLGLPLAQPWRRAAAILVDLVLVAILANAQAVFFAFAAGLFVFWLAARGGKRGRATAVGRRAVRVTLGCLGAVALVVASLAIWAVVSGEPERSVEGPRQVGPEEVSVLGPAVADLVRAAGGGDSTAVAAAAERLADHLRSETMPNDEVDADTLSLDTLLDRYASARSAGDSAAMTRYGPPLGEELEETERALEEERNRGILATVYAILDDVGLSLGWAGLYFTFFLGWWKGRTPGKRLLGIRVARLDGRPLGYWVSFERYGGYAASLFTGLEGFARLIWDPNRQALEDRLAGTVVLRDTAESRERIARLHTRVGAGPA